MTSRPSSRRRAGCCLVLAGLLTGPAAAEDAAPVTGVAERYWTPRDELPESVAARLPSYCDGAYLQPAFPYPRSVDDEDYPLHAEARLGEYWTEADGKVTLSGDVVMRQGNRTLATERATLDKGTNEVTLEGGVSILEPEIALGGAGARTNIDTNAAELEDADYLLLDADMRGFAEHLERDEQGTLRVKRGTFTRCEPGNNTWRISSGSLKVKQGAIFASARNATLRVKGVPIAYTPYIRFPVKDDRQSGFLFPNIEYSGEEGLDLTLPYYFNLAPNYDATVVPRYIAKRGLNLESEFRHLNRWQGTTLSGAILPKDDLYDGTYRKKDFEDLVEAGELAGEFEPADRWLYGMQHRGRLGRFRSYVDYTAVSDRDYFRDLGSDLGISSQIDLERRGELQYNAGGLFARVWAQRFQRLDEVTVDPYQRLPEVDVTYTGDLASRLEYSLGAQWVSFTRDNEDLGGFGAVVGDRLHLEPRVRVPFSWPWGFLNLSGGYRYTKYDLEDVPVGVEEKPDRGIGLGSADAGLYFDRDLELFGTDLVQTLEPRVFYLYQEYEDQSTLPNFDVSKLTFGYSQLYRDNRFSGLDRIGDANQLSIGLTTRFVDGANGREYLRASIGQIVYFRDRRVTLGRPTDDDQDGSSALAGELSFALARAWRLTGTLVWDVKDNQVDEAAAALTYRRDSRHMFNLGYRKRLESNIHQTDAALYWPLGRRFGLIGRWNYDIESGRTIEGLAGIEYNNCCWQLRLVARRYIDSPSAAQIATVDADKGIFFQFVFKGLAGFGDRLEAVLRRGIRGYSTEVYD
jgi:LPS-assembly protein